MKITTYIDPELIPKHLRIIPIAKGTTPNRDVSSQVVSVTNGDSDVAAPSRSGLRSVTFVFHSGGVFMYDSLTKALAQFHRGMSDNRRKVFAMGGSIEYADGTIFWRKGSKIPKVAQLAIGKGGA